MYRRDGGPEPLQPAWADFDNDSRFAQSKRVVDSWRAAGREIAPLRIAVPQTPGGRILFAYVAADFARIGIESRRVAMDAASDLRLIDEAKIDQAVLNIDSGQRARQIGEIETMLGRYTPFIPIATPLRWSVASQRLTGFKPNARAAHPLNRLLARPN